MSTIAISTECYNIFLEILCFLASIFKIKNDINNALSLYHKCLEIAVKTNQFGYLPQILMNLGIMLQKARSYHTSLDCMMRALEFCYLLNDKMYEINIYDSLGMMFYERNEQQKALYYHNRAIKGFLEPNDSIKRSIGAKSAKKFIDSEIGLVKTNGLDLFKDLNTLNPKLADTSKEQNLMIF